MGDLSYGDGTLPGWKGDKATGRQAAFAFAKELPARQQQVLDAFDKHGSAGATCDELQGDLEMPVHIIRPRASELERLGKLFAIGKRPGGMGHNVTIYSTVKPTLPMAEAA